MIDLTPLDVRNKRGDFKRMLRGYDPQEVDIFLELVAERLEGLVRENIQLRERTQTLQQQVTSQLGREQAVQDALVTAQELRADIKAQSQREAEHVLKAAETEARRLIAEAEAEARGRTRGIERQIEGAKDSLMEFERRRARFLKEFRQLLERELDVVEVEERRAPLEERAIDMELGGRRHGGQVPAAAPPPAESSRDAVEEDEEEEPVAPAPDATGSPAGTESPRPAHGPATAPTPASEAPSASASGAPASAAVPEPSAPEPTAAPAREPTTTPAPEASAAPAQSPVGRRAATTEPAPERSGTPRARRGGGPEASRGTAPAADLGNATLAASFEAEAVAEAQSRVVEVKGTVGDDLRAVPRLEEVLAEAGAELAEAGPQDVAPRREARDVHEIAPPPLRGRGDETLLLYLDTDEKE